MKKQSSDYIDRNNALNQINERSESDDNEF